jgi:hypothetical protein
MLDYLQGIEGDIINIVEVFRCQLNSWFVDSCRHKVPICYKKCIPSD